MTESLFIRLGSLANAAIHWLVWSNEQRDIIASGSLPDASALEQLQDKAQQRQVIIFVPGGDVKVKKLQVPAKSARAMQLAAPYMLEDDLAQDVEQLFFAYANLPVDEQNNNCFVVAVERQQMTLWLSWLSEAGIKTKIMLPDFFAMPLEQDAWSVVQLDQQWLIRQSLWQGMTVDVALWPALASNLSLPQSQAVQAYSTFDGVNEQLSVTAMPEELPMALLAQHYNKPCVNLLQGEFQVKEKRSPVLQHWLWAAGIALVAITLNLGINGVQLLQNNARQQALEDEIVSTYQKAFPQSKNVRVATIRSQLKQKLAGVGSNSSDEGFLLMLEKVQPAFLAVQQLKPDSIKFDSKRQELRIDATAGDYQHFEKFKLALEKANLTVSQGALNNKNDQVSGSFSIKGQS